MTLHFAAKLYTTPNEIVTQKTLNGASDTELKLLLRMLYLLSIGHIPIPRDQFNLIASKKKKFLHNQFSSARKVNALLKGNRESQIKTLSKIAIAGVMPPLLFR
jgi:hypothetical protein